MTSLPGPSPLALTLSLLLTTSTLGQDPKCRDCPSYQGCLPTWESHYCVFMPDPDRPYSRNSFLMTHASLALTSVWRVWNAFQERDLATQLQDGVRGFDLDLREHNGVIRVLHKAWDDFNVQAGKEPATFSSALETFRDFLDEHPDQVLTLFYDLKVSLEAVTREHNTAGVARYMYPRSRWPPRGQEWPKLKEMAPAIVVFTEADYDYLIETKAGKAQVDQCRGVPKSRRYDNDSRILLLVKHFDYVTTDRVNSIDELEAKLQLCNDTTGRWANFLEVNFHERNKPESSTIQAVSWLNFQWDPQQNLSRPTTTSHGCHAGGARNVWVYAGLLLFVALNVFH